MRDIEPVLVPGAIYQVGGMGLSEYRRVDVFHGEHTLEFLSVTHGHVFRIKPEHLAERLGVQDA